MSNLFNSIFNDATATASPLQLMLALLVSLILGLALTWTYKYRTLYTREFVISLTLLPCWGPLSPWQGPLVSFVFVQRLVVPES